MNPTSTEGDALEVEADPASKLRANGDAGATAEGEVVAGEAAQVDAPAPPDEAAGEPIAEPEAVADEPEAVADAAAVLEEPRETDEADSAGEAHESASTHGAALDDEPEMIDVLEPEPEPEPDPLITPPEMAQMLFVDVVLMLPATHPVVVLQEADAPFRELRIPVGGAEGIAIAYAARGVATPRPLTHEIFAKLLEEFAMTLDVVRITEVRGNAFSAEIVVSGPLGARLIDCRPSDAIALALRQRLPVPIMASPVVLSVAGTEPLGAN
jgi:hypothetical protein